MTPVRKVVLKKSKGKKKKTWKNYFSCFCSDSLPRRVSLRGQSDREVLSGFKALPVLSALLELMLTETNVDSPIFLLLHTLIHTSAVGLGPGPGQN